MRSILTMLCALLISSHALANPVAELQEESARLASQVYSSKTTIPTGPLLKEGITHSQVGLLTTRLAELGYYVSYTTTFTKEVGDVVEQFQFDHSINADRVVGQQTRISLNTGPEEALQLINQSLTEWNRISNNLPNKYIVVNIPSFELIAYEFGEEVFRSKIVVGSRKHQTPIMQTEAFSLKFNPDWTAPPGIRKRYAARWNAGERDYFTKNVVQVSYDKNGRIKFYQTPANSYLGKLKIELDNPYDVYMHDTNEPELFEKSVRALSNGCIRVQKYKTLAAWLAGTDEDTMQTKIDTGKTFWEGVNRVPVYAVYMLAYPNSAGNVGYFNDVYGIVK